MSEALIEKRTVDIQNQADVLYEKYRDQMDVLQESPLAKTTNGLQAKDVFALGKQLEAFDAYKEICEEEGSLGDLGKLPNVAYDVISISYGTSVLPVIASVQPVEEELGTVYFKNVKAETTKSSITAGDSLATAKTGQTMPDGYASNFVSAETLDTGDGATVSFSGTLAGGAMLHSTLRVTVQDDATTFAIDDGNGNILGAGVYGTINYETGAWTLEFASAPANTKIIYGEYQMNYEVASDIPTIRTVWDSTSVKARVFALKGTFGMLQSYALKKRFGKMAEEELAKDLISEINAEVGGTLIRQLVSNDLGGGISWDKTPATSVSYFEHKQTFKDAIADCEAVISGQAGRGVISVIVAGSNVCAIMSTLPGFVKITNGATVGAHIYGTLDGVTVVKVPDSTALDADKAITMYRGSNPFEAPAVYAPYMPLAVTTTLPTGANPLGNQKAVAVWAGTEVLVNQFYTILTKTES